MFHLNNGIAQMFIWNVISHIILWWSFINIFLRLRITVSKTYSTIQKKRRDPFATYLGSFSAWLFKYRPRSTKINALCPIRADDLVSIVMYATCTIKLLLQKHISITSLQMVYLLMYRQPSVPFIKYQVLEITKYRRLLFFSC